MAPKSGKKSRKWISDQATEISNWMDQKGHDTLSKSEQQLKKFRNHIRKGYRDTIPDLYKATQEINLENSK